MQTTDPTNFTADFTNAIRLRTKHLIASNSLSSKAKYLNCWFAALLFLSTPIFMDTSAHTTVGMTDEVAPVGTYKPTKDQDRERIHSAGNEVSTKSLSSISEAATPHTSAGTMSFLDVLPRELRDAVYDYTFEHAVRRKPDTDDDVTFHFHAPVSNLRLVSRQFTAEYDERYKAFSLRNPSLTIVNDSQDCRRNWYLEVPRLSTRCTELKTIRTLFDGRDEHTELAQRDILQKFLTNFHNTAVMVKRMRRLRRVEMRFNFESLHHSDYLEELLSLFSRLALFRSWPVQGKYELRYEGLTYPQPDRLLELGVPDIGILEAPVTLACWNQASLVELIDRRELERLIRVEAAVLQAWKAKHGCSLWESKRSLSETG